MTFYNDAIDAWMQIAQRTILALARSMAPGGPTGSIASELDARTEGNELPIKRIIIFSDALKPKLIWAIEGTRPHWIGDDQFLYNANNGFSAMAPVWHPGTKADHFTDHAAALAYPALKLLLEKMAGEGIELDIREAIAARRFEA